MPRQTSLFLVPRNAPVKRMRVHDAGPPAGGPGLLVHFRCARCGHDAGWCRVRTVTDGKRGLPCPACNPTRS